MQSKLPDSIHSRSHKSDSTVVAEISLAEAQETKMCCTKVIAAH